MTITAERVRKIFQGLEKGDGAEFFENVADDVDWTVMGTHPLAGHYRSKKTFVAGTFAKLDQVLLQGAELHVEHLLSPAHKDPFYFIEVRLPAGRFDALTKHHLIMDFTKIILLAEGKPLAPEFADRVWVTILEIKEDDWGIGGHVDWLRDYESALDTLGTDLKPRL